MKRILFLIGLMTLVLTVDAEVRTMSDLISIQREVETCDATSLVLLDIGGTLLVPKDASFHPQYQEWTRAWIRSHYPDLTHEEVVKCTRTFEATKEAWRVVNPDWKALLSLGQSQGIKIVAFTKVHMDTSLVGTRAVNLTNHGLKMMDCLPELTTGSSFAYANGVIETGADLKGPVLTEVLSRLSWKPSKIIFVDDRIEQVQSVDAACREAGILCVAFHYTEAKGNPPQFIEENVDYQLRTLIEEGRWVPQENIPAMKLQNQ